MSRLHIFHLCLLSEKGQNWSKNNLEDIIVGKKLLGRKVLTIMQSGILIIRIEPTPSFIFAMENVLIVATADKRLPPQCNAEGG